MKRWHMAAPLFAPVRTALVAALLFSVGCAQQAKDVDRTQPNKLLKSAVAGEFYYRPTVTDVPYTAGFSFVGEQGATERVTFDISEGYLTVRRANEFVRDSEKPYVAAGARYVGAPIAQFRILSHFDVQRTYNPATGEQTNVLEENTADRPWNERQYMRVDWSMNMLTNFNFMAGEIPQSPTPYYVNDPSDPDRWFVAVRDGPNWRDVRDDQAIAKLGSVDYLDVVTKSFAEPGSVDYYGDGSRWVPSCYFFGVYDCVGSEIKVRHSFMRLQKSSYEPLFYPDNDQFRNDAGELLANVRVPFFDKFGFFRTERDTYDRDRGITESGRQYLINRWNIWAQSETTNGQSIPYQQREVKPVIYYLSPGFPSDLRATAQTIIDEWNQPLSQTVDVLTAGQTKDARVFELRDNDFQQDATGRIINFGQRIGDLRFSMFYWVDQPQAAAPLGYGPSATDPVTGEIIQANAFVYGAAVDSQAQYGKDIIDLLNGDLSANKFVSGEASAEQVIKRLNERGFDDQVSSPAALDRALTPSTRARLTAMKTIGKEALLKDPNAALGPLRGIERRPDLLAKLIDEQVIRGTRDEGGPLTSEELVQLSPSKWLTKSAIEREQKRVDKLSRNCVYLAEFADDAILGLARQLKAQGTDPGFDAKLYVRQSIFRAVGAHEVGHTLGLRHNFEGSYDALNFPKRFWELKGEDATPLQIAQTEAQINGRMREFQYSTVMDYGAKFNSDIQGIGRYDQAAIRFGYGLLVDTFTNRPTINDDNHRLFVLGLSPDFLRSFGHYSKLPKVFGGIDKMDQRTIVPYGALLFDQLQGPGRYTEVPYLFCSDEYAGGTPTCARFDQGADPHEIVAAAADQYERYYIFNSFKRDRRYFTPNTYISRIFSRYFSIFQSEYQHWVFRQFSDAPLWDVLSNIQECFNSTTQPEVDCAYLQSADFFTSLKRAFPAQNLRLVNNENWNLDIDGGAAYAAASLDGLNELFKVLETPEPGAYVDLGDYATTTPPPGEDSEDWRAQNRLVPISSNPARLSDCAAGQSSLEYGGSAKCRKLGLSLTDSRYPYTNYDVSAGYYYFQRIAWIGSFYDKITAILTLTDPTTNFIGVDTSSDIRRFAIGYNLLFSPLVHKLFTDIYSDNVEAYAPRTTSTTSIAYRLPFAANTPLDPQDPATSGSMGGELGVLPNPAPSGEIVDPSNNFTVRMYALLYGMAFFSSTFSPAFLETAQICVRGNGECTIPDASVCDVAGAVPNPANRCIELSTPPGDPSLNGRVYRAWKPTAANGQVSASNASGVGSAILQRSAANLAKYQTAVTLYNAATTDAERLSLQPRLDSTLQQFLGDVEDIEVVRGFYSSFGYIQ